MMLTQVYISGLLDIQHDPDPAFAGPGSRVRSGVGSTAKDLEPPYLHYQEADPVMKDRTTTLSRAPHPDDNVQPVAPRRTSNYHYAHMRCAQRTAQSLSARHSAHIVLGNLTGIPWEQVTEVAAVRDSYYLLAAAHRNAARRIERRDRRAENRRLLCQEPARYARLTTRSFISEARHVVRSIRRAVSV